MSILSGQQHSGTCEAADPNHIIPQNRISTRSPPKKKPGPLPPLTWEKQRVPPFLALIKDPNPKIKGRSQLRVRRVLQPSPLVRHRNSGLGGGFLASGSIDMAGTKDQSGSHGPETEALTAEAVKRRWHARRSRMLKTADINSGLGPAPLQLGVPFNRLQKERKNNQQFKWRTYSS